MPNLEVFDVLTEALTLGPLSHACTVVMDGVEHHVRCLFIRRQIPVDVEATVYISAPVTVSLALIDMPRRPRAEDRIVLGPGEAYDVADHGVELGNGMVEVPVTRAA